MDKTKQLLLAATALLFLSVVASCIVYTFTISRLELPQHPSLTNSTETTVQDAKSKEISNYQTLTRELTKQKTDAFDLAITKTLLPLFNTLIAGVFTYIIAKLGISALKNHFSRKGSV